MKESDVSGDEEIEQLKRKNHDLHQQLKEKEKEVKQLHLVIKNLKGTKNYYFVLTIYQIINLNIFFEGYSLNVVYVSLI